MLKFSHIFSAFGTSIEEIQMSFINKAKSIAEFDPELWASMAAENQRQEDHIELIASENYASKCVMEAQGSQLTNKYAEGYPNKRYYGGCEYVDCLLYTSPSPRDA